MLHASRFRPLRRRVPAYGLAIVAVLLALAGRLLLAGVLPPAGFPFLTFFPAVILATLFGGIGPGLLATFLSTAAAKYFFMPALGSFAFVTPADAIAPAFFVAVLLVNCTIIHVMSTSLIRVAEERRRVAELSAARGALAAELELRLDELKRAVAAGERARAELLTKEARFRDLAEALPALLFITAPDGANTYVNRRFQDYTGLPVELLRGNGWLRVIHPEDRARAAEVWSGAVAGGGAYVAEYRFRRHDDTWRWFLVRAEPERGPAGRILRWTGTCTDIDDQRRAEAALVQSEARLRSVVETAADAIIVANGSGHIVSANPAALQMFGYDRAADLIGHDLGVLMPHSEAVRHGGYLAAHRHGSAATPAPARAIGVPGRELMALRRDGTPFPIELSVGSFASGDEHFFTGVVRDVTERRRAEQLRAMLAREVDHRAKNALAVALSLIRLTPREDAGHFAESVEGRIAAMARAHSVLATQKWVGADLRTLALGELAAHSGRVSASGPPAYLAPEAVQAVAMLLHELATNAAKYGALTRPGGQVRLAWAFEASGSLSLAWSERGGPAVQAPPRQRGFGSRLVSTLAAQQLGGSVSWNWEEAGLTCAVGIAARFLRPFGEAQEADGTTQANSAEAAPDAPLAAPILGAAHPRILLVEDEALLAMELEGTTRQLGYEVVGPARTLAEAVRLASTEPDLAAAVLDVNLGSGDYSFPAVDILQTRGVPYIFATGYGSSRSMQGREHGAAAVLIKPYPRQALAEALGAALRRRAANEPPAPHAQPSSGDPGTD
ncbi:PAS domain S-box protein [Roseomonas sp. E05]|uniref:PAS domain S-box protein n=1 Tax=Roseomonas sp. E05 TaxID=3046310 RepID=UPI0024BAFFDD|nr:PAS domain S-box protein [Roseomonas sp. E05]MDJ0387306.1 PAS domain S-box protein [Roseomonas sp. E05]